jgi:hypothetical protein
MAEFGLGQGFKDRFAHLDLFLLFLVKPIPATQQV